MPSASIEKEIPMLERFLEKMDKENARSSDLLDVIEKKMYSLRSPDTADASGEKQPTRIQSDFMSKTEEIENRHWKLNNRLEVILNHISRLI